LGGMLKSETREIAKKLELNVAEKPDSQDICFVPNGDYVSVIKKFKPNAFKKGNIKNTNGKVLGVHDGIANFTIGQRKGIKIAAQDALYVIDIDADQNEIYVGSKNDLLKKEINLRNLNLLSDEKIFENEIYVKIRSTGKLIPSKVEVSGSKAKVNLMEDEFGVSPGQACVFYKKNKIGYKVLGGGWISK